MQIIAALSAQLGRILQPEQALCGELWENLIWKPTLSLPLLRMGSEFAIEETAD